VRLGAHPVLLIARIPTQNDTLKPLAGSGQMHNNRYELTRITYENAAHRIIGFPDLDGVDWG
jgi:hypothetical protein